jgi:hypothetical protein
MKFRKSLMYFPKHLLVNNSISGFLFSRLLENEVDESFFIQYFSAT